MRAPQYVSHTISLSILTPPPSAGVEWLRVGNAWFPDGHPLSEPWLIKTLAANTPGFPSLQHLLMSVDLVPSDVGDSEEAIFRLMRIIVDALREFVRDVNGRRGMQMVGSDEGSDNEEQGGNDDRDEEAGSETDEGYDGDDDGDDEASDGTDVA